MNDTARRRRSSTRIEATAADPMQELLAAMHAVCEGDFSVQLPQHWDGIAGKLADSFNAIVSHNRRMATELALVGHKVGREGRTRQRMAPAARQGQWAGMENSINDMIATWCVRSRP